MNRAQNLPLFDGRWVSELIRAALAEDVGPGDVTSKSLIAETASATLVFRNREPMVVAAIKVIAAVYDQLGAEYELEYHVEDGTKLEPLTALATLTGRACDLLTGERVALNILQRACAVATLTHRYVEAVEGTRAVIRDTRKTMPGMRMLDKYAVRCGGGENHRMGLHDMIMIKDNHIAIYGSLRAAVEQVIAANKERRLPIEVECDNLAQLEEALKQPIDWVLLDNMPPEMLRQAVTLRADVPVKLEASGGITLQAVRAVAQTGVDAISIGALTHSAPTVDIGLDIELRAVDERVSVG